MSLTPSIWSPAPKILQLRTGEVHIWRIDLNLRPDWLQALEKNLSQDEIKRAGQYYFRRDRNRFIASHGCLREILACYLHLKPEQISIRYNAYGKPALDAMYGARLLCFNLAHSHELGLIAVCLDRAIGVDIEYIRPVLDEEKIAQRFFSADEVTALSDLPHHLRNEAFFNCWTRKEAFIKAKGEGLQIPLDLFDVTLIPGEPAILLNTRFDPEEASNWSLYHIDPGSGYTAALAVEGEASRLQFFQFTLSERI